MLLSILISCIAVAQTNNNKTLIFDGQQRNYIVYLPSSYDGIEEMPLVIVLHGGSGSALSTQNFTQMNSVAEQEGFLAVYPQGLAPSQSGGFVWADGRGTSADLLGVDDVGFLDELVRILIRDYTIDANRVYLTGFSNGAFMTQRMACERNGPFAAMASLGSTMDTILFNECNPERTLPMLLLMGTEDPFVPYNGGPMNGNVTDIVSNFELFNFWSQNNGCNPSIDSFDLPNTNSTDNSSVTVFEQTGCFCDTKVVHYRINGGGHTWPGVEIVNYELIAGETNEDIHASEEVWKFFQAIEKCEMFSTAVDRKNNFSFEINISPNPTGNDIKVISEQVIESVKILNIKGELLQWLEPNSKELNINLSSQTSGIYLVQFYVKDSWSITKRVIKY